MSRLIALSPNKKTKRTYKSPKRLAAKKVMLAKKAGRKGEKSKPNKVAK